jgi:surface protein
MSGQVELTTAPAPTPPPPPRAPTQAVTGVLQARAWHCRPAGGYRGRRRPCGGYRGTRPRRGLAFAVSLAAAAAVAAAIVPAAVPPPWWVSKPPPFTSTADLRKAAEAFDGDVTSAIATYGPIAEWGVSAISNMKELFRDLVNFNADISGWDTSGVTDMSHMFYVGVARPRAPRTHTLPIKAHSTLPGLHKTSLDPFGTLPAERVIV